jgi:DNA-binding FrmR family transcriptional regulator
MRGIPPRGMIARRHPRDAPMPRTPASRTRSSPAPQGDCCHGAAAAAPAAVRKALAVDGSLKASNLRQLRRIEGQIRGIAAMIEGDRYCADVITQVAAARESLRTVARNLLKNHLRHCAARAMSRTGANRDAMIDELLALTDRMDR